MSYAEKLNAEIAAKIETLKAEGKPLHASWITHAICDDHLTGLAENDHADFWRHGGYAETRKRTTKYIGTQLGDRDAERVATRSQGWLPGFTHLQSHYVIDRAGDEIGVPAFDCTDAELSAKADLYDGMSAACHEHADEIRRFIDWRRSQKAAAQ